MGNHIDDAENQFSLWKTIQIWNEERQGRTTEA